ncbi:MAG: ABC transporter ATP-binding protein [Candidatus Methanomethylophilaceae archaeon]
MEGLCKDFGTFRALDNIDLEIREGQMVGLIGPNGCGKSTLMKCVSKIHNVTAGKISVNGRDILKTNAHETSKMVATVPAEIEQIQNMSVTDMVMLGRYPYVEKLWWETDEDEVIIRNALKKFGIYEHRKKQVSMLSSGERQRALIAKAYVQEPELLLVDEPTSHLDLKFKLNVMEHLRSLAKTGMTLLVAEHDISLVSRYCDYCFIMKQGKIVTSGVPSEIITEDLMREVYEVEARVGTDIDGELYVLPKRSTGEV